MDCKDYEIISANMKRTNLLLALVTGVVLLLSACTSQTARDQWPVQKALEWEKEIGVIKGANGYYMVNPAKSSGEVLQKMSGLGFNSVRAWIGGETAQSQIEALEKLLDAADDYGMTVSPVLTIGGKFKDPAQDAETEPIAEEMLKTILSHFRGDKRIAFWDLWNEPPYNPNKADVLRAMDLLEKMVLWGREAGTTQPLTSSIFWDIVKPDRSSEVFQRRLEVERMMDIHNYHDYSEAEEDGKYSREMIRLLKELDGRPVVCTECLNRQNGSGIERALSIFAEEQVHFYVWGVYANDRNWSTRWRKSEFDPYARMFHNMLYADGDPCSPQEVQWIKDFHFCEPGETMDPGIEVTDRWQRDRVWKRMALGPVKGYVSDSPQAVPAGYNSVKVNVRYSDWKKDREAVCTNLKNTLKAAADKGCLVVPTLLTQQDGHDPEHAGYVRDIIHTFAHAREVFAWDIYDHPTDSAAVRALFKAARGCQSAHPLFMVPAIGLEEFPEGFDYKAAMVHGKTAGWEHFQFADKKMEQVCSLAWNLSDVIAYDSPFALESAGWIGAVARRYGRPVFAFLQGKAAGDRNAVLDLLSRTQLYWWTTENLGAAQLAAFRFQPVTDWD